MERHVRHLVFLGILLSTLSIQLEGYMNRNEACSRLCGGGASGGGGEASAPPMVVPWARTFDDELGGRKGSGEFTDNGSGEGSGELIPPPPRPSPGRPGPGPAPTTSRPMLTTPRSKLTTARPIPGPPTRPTEGPTGPEPTGPEPTGPEPTGPEPTGPEPTGPPPPDPGPEPTGPMPGPDPGPTGPDPGASITGELNFNWDTTVGWNTTIRGGIEGGREHIQNISLDNGGYIYDKDWLKWQLAFESNPHITSTFGVKGGIRFGNIGGGIGGRRKRRDVGRRAWK